MNGPYNMTAAAHWSAESNVSDDQLKLSHVLTGIVYSGGYEAFFILLLFYTFNSRVIDEN